MAVVTSKLKKVIDGNDDLIRVQVSEFGYRKMRRSEAIVLGLFQEPVSPAPVEVVEEKPVVKQRRKASNKMIEPQDNKGTEEATSG